MKGVASETKVDPLEYAGKLKSPIGVYLRHSVLEHMTKSDNALRKKLYGRTISSQSKDGSWNQLIVKTANNLWNVALMGYEANDSYVQKGLEWLLSTQKYEYRGYPGFFHSGNRKESSTMRSTRYGEFGPGCTIFYTTPYAVHLFHMYGLGKKKEVQRTVDSYLKFWTPDWCGSWCTVNVLRMLIEHPKSADTKRVRDGINHLANIQTATGSWRGFPFYHTFHALSRSKQNTARKQIQNTLPSIMRRQNADGSWGKKHKEMDTFLVLDGLKNAGVL